MGNFKTITAGGKVNSFIGELKMLAETKDWYQKVELWLLNDITNRNNWRYERLDEHKKLFAGTPILVAYVGNNVGDGHNFEEVRNADGSVTASFMSATAERVVGYFKDDSNIRIEVKDGQKWIVGTGYIWKWYAQELVAKLKKQGIEGMPISIETLVDEMYMDGTTEVFTKWQVLGTTILGLNVAPAVADANIRALSAIGSKEVREMTLRVASAQQQQAEKENKNPQNKKNQKGVTNTMKVKDLENKFPNFTVLAVNGKNVALLSDKGVPYISTAEKNGEEIAVGLTTEIAVNACFGDGEDSVKVPVDLITEKLNAEIIKLKTELEKANGEKTTAMNALEAMQKAEKARRINAVKEAIKKHLAEIKANTGADIDDNECDDLMTDEKLEEYSECEDKAGAFCGEERACKDVDARCMTKIIEAGKAKQNAQKNKFAWNDIKKNSATEEESDIEKLINKFE